jgi:arylsulfatase A-like enzyme
MQRRTFLTTLGGSALGAQQQRKPNIIWLMADDLGWGDVGCHGQKWIRTPNVDRLAAEGMRFTDGYAGCTVCAPSRSVLMTGLHTGHTPVRSNPGGVPLLPEERTVADLLHAAGYRTGLFGKWGLGDIGTTGVPWKHGYDEFFGFLHQAHAHFQYPRFLYSNDKEYPLTGNDSPGRQTFANDVMHEKSLDFIRRSKDRPFFLYASPTIPHFEPHVPEDSLAEYRGKVPNGKPYIEGKRERLKRQDELGPAYAGMVTRVDRYLGNIMRLLKELNLDRDTLVFFTSDNGGMFKSFENDFFRNTGPYRGQKGTFYEGGIRVPLIARWPGRIKAGQVSNFMWAFQDFLPTAAEVAGVSAPAGIDGLSVLPSLLGKSQKPHPYLYWELPRYNGQTGTFSEEAPSQAMRRGDWKAVRPKGGGALELYDLSKDPGEANNLAASRPELVTEFEKLLKAARTPPRPQKEPPHPWWDVKS